MARAGRGGGLNRSARRLQNLLVMAEVALSIVPLMAAGLMLRTFANLVHAPIGFHPQGLITAKMPMDFRAYPDAASRWRVQREAMAGVRNLPGVQGVSAAAPLPFQQQVTRRFARAEDPEGAMPVATQQTVAPGFLALAGITLEAGRDFTPEDIETARRVAIVDERLAQRLWPAGAVGRRLAIWAGRTRTELEVVGVTNALRVSQVRDDQTPHYFVPYPVFPIEMSLVVKTDRSVTALGPALKQIIEAAGTRRAPFDVRPMEEYVTRSIGDSRFLMLILTAFAVASLVLAAMGLYGTLAYLVAQRRHELGVRIALGATGEQIVSMVMGEGARLTLYGAAVGVLGAWSLTGLLRGFLYGVAPFDWFTLAGVAAVVALSAVGSTMGPAWRASRMDPNLALRNE